MNTTFVVFFALMVAVATAAPKGSSSDESDSSSSEFLNWHWRKGPALPVLSRLTLPSLQPSRTATQPMEVLLVSKPFQPWPPALPQLDKKSKTEKHWFIKEIIRNFQNYQINIILI
jgi:hypothetical protein